MERDAVGARKVNPYHLLFQGGQFYLLGHSHERDALRVFRLSRIRGKVAYATKAEHDFKRPADFDPRPYAHRADWQFGDEIGVGRIHISERIAWQVERHFGRFGEVLEAEGADDGIVFETPYASERQLASWVLRMGGHARVEGPPELAQVVADRVELLHERHAKPIELARASRSKRAPASTEDDAGPAGKRETPIRPERFARLVTLASILIEAGRAGKRLDLIDVCERLQISEAELREDINVLNVVNFGGGSYVLYAEIDETLGEIEVDPEPYSDNFARPARLLPVEAKALVAAIDLIGDHLPEGSLSSAREKIVAALGADPMEQGLQVARTSGDDCGHRPHRVGGDRPAPAACSSTTTSPTRTSSPSASIEPYALINGREGWYVAAFDPSPRRRAPLPPGPDPLGDRDRHRVRAAARGRPGGRRRGLAADRRGPGVAHRPRLGRSRARPLGARGAPGRPGAGRRLGGRRAELRRQRLARARGPQGGRRRRRARARGRARRGAGCGREAARHGPRRALAGGPLVASRACPAAATRSS